MKAFEPKQSGFSLVEVLVTVVISTIGILGMASIQLTSLKSSHHSFFHTQASLLSYEIIDDMRANRNAAVNNDYDTTLTSPADISDPGDDASIADKEKYKWYRKMATILPKAKASIVCDVNDTCQILIQWSNHVSQETSEITMAAQP
jgi:type IV pilus assembly protein PilV